MGVALLSPHLTVSETIRWARLFASVPDNEVVRVSPHFQAYVDERRLFAPKQTWNPATKALRGCVITQMGTVMPECEQSIMGIEEHIDEVGYDELSDVEDDVVNGKIIDPRLRKSTDKPADEFPLRGQYAQQQGKQAEKPVDEHDANEPEQPEQQQQQLEQAVELAMPKKRGRLRKHLGADGAEDTPEEDDNEENEKDQKMQEEAEI